VKKEEEKKVEEKVKKWKDIRKLLTNLEQSQVIHWNFDKLYKKRVSEVLGLDKESEM
jgi:hypothetical protein